MDLDLENSLENLGFFKVPGFLTRNFGLIDPSVFIFVLHNFQDLKISFTGICDLNSHAVGFFENQIK